MSSSPSPAAPSPAAPSPAAEAASSIEVLSEDVLRNALRRVGGRDRISVACVSRTWRRLERESRIRLDLTRAGAELHRLLALYPNVEHLTGPQKDLAAMAAACPRLQTLILLPRHGEDLGEEEEEEEEEEDPVVSLARNCAQIRSLEMPRCRAMAADPGLSALAAACRFLHRLDISESYRASDAGIHALSAMPRLASLILRNSALISDRSLSSLSSGSTRISLRELDLSGCHRITDAGVACLREMQALELLSLARCGSKITDLSSQRTISAMPSLRRLDLSWLPEISDHSLVDISRGCPQLQELLLTGCCLVSGLGAHAFSDHPSLQALLLDKCAGVLDTAAALLADLALRCSSLEFLKLDWQVYYQFAGKESVDAIQSRCRIEWSSW
jgi:F-box/leucine-rich repeat protein 2/20